MRMNKMSRRIFSSSLSSLVMSSALLSHAALASVFAPPHQTVPAPPKLVFSAHTTSKVEGYLHFGSVQAKTTSTTNSVSLSIESFNDLSPKREAGNSGITHIPNNQMPTLTFTGLGQLPSGEHRNIQIDIGNVAYQQDTHPFDTEIDCYFDQKMMSGGLPFGKGLRAKGCDTATFTGRFDGKLMLKLGGQVKKRNKYVAPGIYTNTIEVSATHF